MCMFTRRTRLPARQSNMTLPWGTHSTLRLADCAPSGPGRYTEIFAEALIELAAEDEASWRSPPPWGKTPSLPSHEGTRSLLRRQDGGAARRDLAAGLAAAGLRPVVAIYSTFHSAPMTGHRRLCRDCRDLLLDRESYADGPTHHGVYDLFMQRFPGSCSWPLGRHRDATSDDRAAPTGRHTIATHAVRAGVAIDRPCRCSPLVARGWRAKAGLHAAEHRRPAAGGPGAAEIIEAGDQAEVTDAASPSLWT